MWRLRKNSNTGSEEDIITAYREQEESIENTIQTVETKMTTTKEIVDILTQALEHQAINLEARFEAKLETVTTSFEDKIEKSKVPSVGNGEAIRYEKVKIVPGTTCDVPLDMVKSLPEFDGKQNEYVAWREAAAAAYEVFEPFNGSTKHFLAVGIIRNKVKGAASSTLTSYNTTLNFQAILARLDFVYADKTPIRVL